MKKKLIIIFGLLVFTIIIYKFFNQESNLPETNIINEKNKITYENYKQFFKTIRFENEKPDKYFSNTTINNHTISFFRFLQRQFKKENIEDHFDAVKDYLYSKMEDDKAEEMFELYKKYLGYLEHKKELAKNIEYPKTIEDMLLMVRNLQDDRRKFFGKDTADLLYGTEVKITEYDLRKSNIINDKNMTGEEKEESLKRLQEKMWEGDADNITNSQKPMDKYNEKMRMYENELSDLSAEEKKEKVQEIRNQCFSPEVAAQLNRKDNYNEFQLKKKESYHKSEDEILNDDSLTQEEKEAKVYELQKEMYGKDADIFRQRENYRKKLENQ